MAKKIAKKTRSNNVKKAVEKKEVPIFKTAIVNQHDEYVHNQFLKLIETLEKEKNKANLSSYKLSRVYPLSNFFVGNVDNMLKTNCAIFTFIKIAYALGFDVELKVRKIQKNK